MVMKILPVKRLSQKASVPEAFYFTNGQLQKQSPNKVTMMRAKVGHKKKI